MKLNNRNILIFILIMALLYSNDLFKGNYFRPLLKTFKLLRTIGFIGRGRSFGSLMRFNRGLHINRESKILNNIINDYNKSKKRKENKGNKEKNKKGKINNITKKK